MSRFSIDLFLHLVYNIWPIACLHLNIFKFDTQRSFYFSKAFIIIVRGASNPVPLHLIYIAIE